MTYFGFLALFLGLPILVFAWLRRRDRQAGRMILPAWSIGLLALIAVVYTTPWDNYLVATRVWWYDPDLVTGLVLGWVPIEEYTFFVVQPILIGLWMSAWLSRAGGADLPRFIHRSGVRAAAAAAAGLAWVAAVLMLAIGDARWTYLGLELVWALPPIALQLAFGADILIFRWRLVLLGIVLPTLYLSAADALAIGWGTWTIDPAQSTGLLLGGVLPVEEFIFFLLTNVLLAFAYVLVSAPESRARLRAFLARFREDPAGETA